MGRIQDREPWVVERVSFLVSMTPTAFSEVLYLLFRFVWENRRFFSVTTLAFLIVGAVFGGGIWIAAPLAGISDIRWNVLVAFGAGYAIEYLLTVIKWGTQNFHRDGRLDVRQNTMRLSTAVLALHGLIGSVLVLVALSTPRI